MSLEAVTASLVSPLVEQELLMSSNERVVRNRKSKIFKEFSVTSFVASAGIGVKVPQSLPKE